MNKVIIYAAVTLCLLVLTGCGKRYTTCDCADLTYELYKKYDAIIFSDLGVIKKALAMRRAKMELKKDERYKFCREQGVRPLSIVHYPMNKKIFANCDSWIKMEQKIDELWEKIKDTLGINNKEIEEGEL